MTIRSMDMQVLVQKIGEVARIQHIQQQEHSNRQQDFSNQINEQTAKNSRLVNAPMQNESKMIHEKQENDDQSKKKNKKDQEKDKKEETQTMSNAIDSGHKLDITI